MTDIATAATDALVSGAAGAAAAVVEAGARALSRRIFPPARPRFPLPYDAAAVSYSQIDKFERCARAYWFRYRDPDRRGRAKVSSPEAALGTVTHLAIELLVRYVVDNNAAAEWGPDLARDAWEEAWQRDGTLSGDAAYREGCNMVADYVRVYDAPTDVLDVERHFEIAIPSRATGRVYKLRGAFDRVDKLSARAVRVIDYKSNRLPYTSDDLADDLQMSIYRLAAAECYPWAETADLTFIMLRHGFPQRAERTLDDIESTRRYLANVCDRIFAASDDREEWPTTLSGDCSRCDDRSRCSVFARALLGRGDVVKFRDLSVQLRERPEGMADGERLCRERADAGAIAKACDARPQGVDARQRRRRGARRRRACLAGLAPHSELRRARDPRDPRRSHRPHRA